MYKVFYNQKQLDFTSDLEKNSLQTPLFFIKYASSKSIIKALRNHKVLKVYLYHQNPNKFKKHLFKIFPTVMASGGLVKHKNGSYLFIYRNDKWDLPKGKVNKNEIILDAAVREVSEETGVGDLVVNKTLPSTFHIFKSKGKFKIKKTYWFLMKSSYQGNLIPQIEENIEMAVWKTKTEIPELMKNAYENIKDLIQSID